MVIPVRDRHAELARCLAGLAGTSRVIVVDDGSADPAAIQSAAAAAGASVVRRPVNGGPAAARNTGLAAAQTPLVAFLDSDCVPGARLAGRAAAALRRSRGGRGRPAHRAARGRAHLAGPVRGGELHPGHGMAAQHRPAGITGAVRPRRRPGRPQGGRRDRLRRGHAGGGGRRLRLAAGRVGLAGALRARGHHGAPAPGAAARVVLPAEGLRDVRGRAGTPAPGRGPAALRVGVDRGGLAGGGARPPGGRRRGHRHRHRPAGPAAGPGHRRGLAPSRPDRPRGGWPSPRPAAGRSPRPARWAARSAGPGGRWRCRPRSRCGGCGCRWPRWCWRRRCWTGWTAGRRSTRRGTWPPGCSTTPGTAWGCGRGAWNAGPFGPCCRCCAGVTVTYALSFMQAPAELGGHDDVVRGQLADGGPAEREQRRVDAAAEHVEDVLDARPSRSRPAPTGRRGRS